MRRAYVTLQDGETAWGGINAGKDAVRKSLSQPDGFPVRGDRAGVGSAGCRTGRLQGIGGQVRDS